VHFRLAYLLATIFVAVWVVVKGPRASELQNWATLLLAVWEMGEEVVKYLQDAIPGYDGQYAFCGVTMAANPDARELLCAPWKYLYGRI
jgi:hypothetical protein